MVGAASCEMLDIRGEKDTSNVLVVSLEMGNWDEGGLFSMLDEKPNKDITLMELISCRPK